MAEIIDTLRLDVDQALRDVNRIEQALDRALAPVELRIDDSSLQNVESNLRDIRSVVDDTTDSVRLTAAEYREVSAAIERGITPARAIADATGQVQDRASLAEANFRDLAQALDVSEDEARRLTAEILDSQQAAQRLEEATRDVVRQLGLSDDEADRLTRSLRQADRAAADINTRGTTLVGTFGNLRTAIAGIGGLLAVVGGAQILSGAVRGISTALTQFQALNESINAVQVTFGSASQTVLDFGEISAQAAGLSAAAFQQAVVPIGSVLTNFGFNAREAADASVVLVQRAADLASVFNTDVSEALLAINSALVGQVEPLRRYGAEINQARVQQFALATGIAASLDEFDLQAQVAARVGLILQDTARVQGDFANTSDQLANAQRSAAAEAENFAADVGEALAPAMATLVTILPEVLDGVRQLIPTFAAGADSAAEFFQSINEGTGGFRTPFAAFAGGLGTVTDAFAAFADIGSFVFDTFTFEFERAGLQVDQFGTRLARTAQRVAASALARNLDAGEDAALAFANALSFLARESENVDAFGESFRGLAIAADLTKRELLDVTRFLLDNAIQAGLSAQEIAVLESQYALLRNTLFVVGNEVEQAARGFAEIDRPLTTAGSRFTTFSGEVEDAQTRSSAALTQLAADTEAQLARAAAAFDLFAESPERITGSFRRAVETLRDQVQDAFDFDINLAILRALNLDTLADEFQKQGVAAASQLAQAVEDIPLAIEANQLLQGFASDVAEGFIDELVKRLVDFGLSPSEAQKIAQTLTSPQVIAAATEAAKSFAGTQSNAYRDALLSGMDQLVPELAAEQEQNANIIWDDHGISFDAGSRDAEEYAEGIASADLAAEVDRILTNLAIEVDLFFVGQEAGQTLINGMIKSISSSQAVNDLHVAIEDATNNAIEARSPSRLMLRIGEAAGDAFWSGFNQADLTLRTPIQQMTGRIVDSSTVSGVASGGVNVNINLDHASLQDPISDVARMGQIASSIANTYRQVT